MALLVKLPFPYAQHNNTDVPIRSLLRSALLQPGHLSPYLFGVLMLLCYRALCCWDKACMGQGM